MRPDGSLNTSHPDGRVSARGNDGAGTGAGVEVDDDVDCDGPRNTGNAVGNAGVDRAGAGVDIGVGGNDVGNAGVDTGSGVGALADNEGCAEAGGVTPSN